MDADVEAFERVGCRLLERRGAYEAVLAAPGGAGTIVVRLSRAGRFFGGNWGMEVSTAEPVLPPSAHGLSARGRGVVKQHGVRFRARRGAGADAARLTRLLTDDAALADALGRVHFEEVGVRADGRPVIRHLGGSVVWVLFPPIVRGTPLPPGQPQEVVRALAEFRRAAHAAMRTG